MRQKGKGIGSQKEETGKRGERVRKVRGKHQETMGSQGKGFGLGPKEDEPD